MLHINTEHCYACLHYISDEIRLIDDTDKQLLKVLQLFLLINDSIVQHDTGKDREFLTDQRLSAASPVKKLLSR